MSNAVFPSLPGLEPTVQRTPMWQTDIQGTPSGREYRGSAMTSPRYRYRMSFEFLRDSSAFPELATLVGFFNARKGSFDSFLLSDPSDAAVVAQTFGIGDGASVLFQLVRTYGGAVEPVYDVNGAPVIYLTDVLGLGKLLATPRTNMVTRSQEFDSLAWADSYVGGTGLQPVRTANDAIAPDGTLTADKVVLDRGAGTTSSDFSGIINGGVSGTVAGLGYVFSVWMKTTDASSKIVRIDFSNNAGTNPNKTVTGAWTRFDTYLASAADAVRRPTIRLRGNLGTDASASLHLWGAQFELAQPDGLPTRYIATAGSTVTRTDYTLNATGGVTLASAPASGALLSWDGGYYWRCRFADDSLSVEQFLAKLWASKSVELMTVKP